MRLSVVLALLATAACQFQGAPGGELDPAGPDAAASADAARLNCSTDARYVEALGISLRVEAIEKQDWASARDICVAEGGQLAVLDTTEKRDAAASLTQSGHTWIGLEAIDPLTWRWVNGTTISVETKGQDGWGMDRPDSGPPGQACARFRGDAFFDDEPCEQVRDFACECLQ